jgi:hypothetical protein
MIRSATLSLLFMVCGCGAEEPATPEATNGGETAAPPPEADVQSAPSGARADAENICRAATEARSIRDPIERAMAFADGLSRLTLTRETARGFQALDAVEPSERYSALQQVFADQGVTGWQCESLATWWAH